MCISLPRLGGAAPRRGRTMLRQAQNAQMQMIIKQRFENVPGRAVAGAGVTGECTMPKWREPPSPQSRACSPAPLSSTTKDEAPLHLQQGSYACVCRAAPEHAPLIQSCDRNTTVTPSLRTPAVPCCRGRATLSLSTYSTQASPPHARGEAAADTRGVSPHTDWPPMARRVVPAKVTAKLL